MFTRCQPHVLGSKGMLRRLAAPWREALEGEREAHPGFNIKLRSKLGRYQAVLFGKSTARGLDLGGRQRGSAGETHVISFDCLRVLQLRQADRWATGGDAVNGDPQCPRTLYRQHLQHHPCVKKASEKRCGQVGVWSSGRRSPLAARRAAVAGAMAFFQRVMSYLLNEVLVNGLANR